MAALSGSRGDRLSNSSLAKSALSSPEKVRAILNEEVSSTDRGSPGSSAGGDGNVLELKNNTQAPCEATNKEAFFSRVESYSCLKWAGKPRTLSPLMCARYGWINVRSDMLKCSSCQAFLCASLQPTLDFEKYESRIAEISRQLQTQHKKFCPWPDFPCPERLWLVPDCEPSTLLAAFLDRFHSACLLAQQLPAMKPEQLKSMSLTEEVISVVLQLVEEEQKKRGKPPCSQSLAVQVAACVVSLCGWAASPALHAMSLPILTCSYCMRKVGLWNFHQMAGASGAEDAPASAAAGQSAQTTGPAPGSTPEGQAADRTASASPTPAATPPSRMKLRSQDSTRSEQGEAPSPVALRARSRDSPSPSEELPSPLSKGKRPATRSRGPGDTAGTDGAASPIHPAKRLCLSAGSDELLPRSPFDPLAQHRDWCPWISVGKENQDPGAVPYMDGGASAAHRQGWKAALDLLMPMKKNSDTTGSSPAQGAREKSKKVFAIFRQWQVSWSPSLQIPAI